MNKTLRQRAVLDVLKHGSVASQEDLQRHLRRRGFKVGQATLSRDIRDLNLSKTSQGYALPHGENGVGIALPPVSRLVREFVLDVRSAQNLLVVKTIVGRRSLSVPCSFRVSYPNNQPFSERSSRASYRIETH